MFLTTVVVASLVLGLPSTQGLDCWECANAHNDTDCLNNGKLVTCRLNEENCFTEVRKVHNNPFKKRIFRRCKQEEACGNNHIQNPRPAWMPTQCNAIDGSVCRCCCSHDGCNSREETSCQRPQMPIPDPNPCVKDENLLNGHGHCDVYFDQTVCHYSCKTGFVMFGTSYTVCKHANPGERTPKPICEVPPKGRCKQLTAPENGNMICSDSKNEQGTECAFSCDQGYRMIGQPKLTCTTGRRSRELKWNYEVPTCKFVKCKEQTFLRRVVKDCTNSNLFGSVCEFTCSDPNYVPEKNDTAMKNFCQFDGRWSHPAPCCKFPCPPKTIMDLIVVLDSSSSVGKNNWIRMQNFTSGVLGQFILSEEFVQVFLMRYNSEVDEENQLMLRNKENEAECLEALQSIPYNGKGTLTGKAMKYVKDNMLQKAEIRKDKPQVVLLITDGIAQDRPLLNSVSLEIRQMGVEIYAVGVGKARKEELKKVTGSWSKVWAEVSDFQSLTVEAARQIGNYICRNSCA